MRRQDPHAVRRRIARNIRRLAEERGLSLNELADVAGVSRGHLFNALAGSSALSTDWLTLVANALDVRTSELLG